MEKTTKPKPPRNLRHAAFVAGATVVIGGFAWIIQTYRIHHATAVAEGFLKQGFGTLAAEALDPFRYSLATNERGCALLTASYYRSHQTNRLEWAAETCLSAGIETPDTYIGYAAARESTNQDSDALQILNHGLEKFGKSSEIYYRLGLILRRTKRDAEAIQAFLKATELAPSNNSLSLEALTYFISQTRFKDARAMADRLKTVETENPEVKLVLARAYKLSGDKPGLGEMLGQAKVLLARKPELAPALEQLYADVFRMDIPLPTPNRTIARKRATE
jgi:predicted Zn-dependent protease